MLQVPVVAAEAQAALAAGQAVVIGLQSTGEAAADAMQLEPGQACGFVSTTRELLSRFVTQHFPVRYEPGPNEPAGVPLLDTLSSLTLICVVAFFGCSLCSTRICLRITYLMLLGSGCALRHNDWTTVCLQS